MKTNTSLKHAVSWDHENMFSSQSLTTDWETKGTFTLGTQCTHTDPLFQEAFFFFNLVIDLYMKSGRHKPTLFAEITRAMQTEIKTHYTSSKCSSRIQLSPRRKQDGSMPHEGGKQFQELYILKYFHLWLGNDQTFKTLQFNFYFFNSRNSLHPKYSTSLLLHS